MALSPFGKLVAAVENTAAILLFAVTVISFAAVCARYLFNAGIPDAFDGSRYLLGVVIFWGLASACHRGEHITMDAAWTLSPRRLKHMLDIIANAIICAALAVFLWQFSERLLDTWASGIGTIELDLPVAAFFLLAWNWTRLRASLAIARLVRIARGTPDKTEIPTAAG
jgi:C4-dicarboxylate transporter DctQ subunit